MFKFKFHPILAMWPCQELCRIWDFILLTTNYHACLLVLHRSWQKTRLLGQRKRTLLQHKRLIELQVSGCWLPWPPSTLVVTQRARYGCRHIQWGTLQETDTGPGGCHAFTVHGVESLLFVQGKYYLIPQGCSLQMQPWETAQVKGSRDLEFLVYQ